METDGLYSTLYEIVFALVTYLCVLRGEVANDHFSLSFKTTGGRTSYLPHYPTDTVVYDNSQSNQD